jgi:polar amino acid transport system permease protein
LFFDWSLIVRNQDAFTTGLWLTCLLSLTAGALSLVLGFSLAALRIKAGRLLGPVLTAYVELMRNTPLLLTLYLIYFGLPMVGLAIPTFTCVVVALVLQHTVFVSEIIRGGFLSVPNTQIEAGRALGMTPFEVFRIVRFPQAFSAALPALMGALIILVHDTSLGAAISLVDLTMAAKVVSQRTASSFEPFVAIAILYSLISWVLSRIGAVVERRTAIAR